MSRDITLYIVDIFIAIDKIKRYSKPFFNAQELLYSEMAWDACIRELELIGEATKYLLNANLLDNSYRRVVDFRNQITHGYFGINEDIVWDVINPKFALADTSSVSVIGSMGIEEKPQRTLRVRLRFSSTPLLPSTNTSDAPSNAKFGIKNKIPEYEKDLLKTVKEQKIGLKSAIKSFYNDNLSKNSIEYLKFLEKELKEQNESNISI